MANNVIRFFSAQVKNKIISAIASLVIHSYLALSQHTLLLSIVFDLMTQTTNVLLDFFGFSIAY
jgi:hypothetical protein